MKQIALLTVLMVMVCQTTMARQATKGDVVGTTWKMIVTGHITMAGEDIVEFTDSTFSHRFYLKKMGTKVEFVRQKYEIIDGEMVLGNGGRYVLHIDDNDGHLTMIQEDCLAFDYRKMSKGEVGDLEASVADDMTSIANMSLNILNGETRTLNFILDNAGGLSYGIRKQPRHTLHDADKIRICGPLNGADISAIRELVADSAALPNLKTLDLSRTWIISDSVTFRGYVNNMSHAFFAGLKGRRRMVDLPEEFAKEWGISRKAELLQDAYGYAIEVIPDSFYISFTATIADCVMKYMFAGMPYVEHLILPESIREIHYGAMSHCPQLKEITIPKSVRIFESGVFNGDKRLGLVRVSDKYDLLKTKQFDLNDRERTAFLNANADVKFETYSEKSPIMIDDELAKYKEYFDSMTKLRKEKRALKQIAAKESNSDSIKAIKERTQQTTTKMWETLSHAIRDNKDNMIAARLLGYFCTDLHPHSIEALLIIMNDENAFSQYARPAWQYLKDMTSVSDVDWNQFSDTTRMEKIHVAKAGTLRFQKTEEEWVRMHRIYVSGVIDSTDISWLRVMAGSEQKRDKSKRWGALQAIDLSAARLDYLPDNAFAQCLYLKYIRLPENMHTIGKNAFGRSSLQTVVMAESLHRIRGNAFSGCRNIIRIEIPDSVITIASNAFTGCRNLQDVKLSERLDTLGMTVFEYCPNLKRIHLPASLRSIGLNYFINSPEIEVTIDPANENFTVVEGQIVGLTPRAQENLRQYKRKDRNKTNRKPAETIRKL